MEAAITLAFHNAIVTSLERATKETSEPILRYLFSNQRNKAACVRGYAMKKLGFLVPVQKWGDPSPTLEECL